jgi:hypothetical protein
MKGKRRLERFDLYIPTTLEFQASDQERSLLNLLTSNISSFYTARPLPKGTQVKIGLFLPLDKLIKLKDEHKATFIKITETVSRSESEGMATCFDEDYQIIGSTQLQPCSRKAYF